MVGWCEDLRLRFWGEWEVGSLADLEDRLLKVGEMSSFIDVGCGDASPLTYAIYDWVGGDSRVCPWSLVVDRHGH